MFVFVSVSVCLCVCVCACFRVCVYVCVNTCLHTISQVFSAYIKPDGTITIRMESFRWYQCVNSLAFASIYVRR